MYSWKPPKGTKVVFGFEEFRPGTVEGFCKLFGLRYKQYVLQTRRLDDPRWPAMITEVDRLRSRSMLQWRACWLEEPPHRASDPNAWFELVPAARQFRSADRMREGDHFACSGAGYVCSSKFGACVQDNRWTGLDFLPLVPRRGLGSTAWRQAYATQPLSRGVHHPMMDPQLLERRDQIEDCDPDLTRVGNGTVWAKHIRDDVEILDEVVKALLFVARTHHFRIAGARRIVREHLPSSDFAYSGWPRVRVPGELGGGRTRSITCNALVRLTLIEAGLMTAPRFRPIQTVAASDLEPWVEVLDRRPHPLPPPSFTPEEAQSERVRRNGILAAKSGSSVPVSRSTLTSPQEAIEALQKLAALSSGWLPARIDPDLAPALRGHWFSQTPIAWQLLAPHLPARTVARSNEQDSAACGDAPTFQFQMCVPHRNEWTLGDRHEEPDEAPSKRDIVIGETDFGDWFSTRPTDPFMPDDARVTWWDHETLSPVDEWPSVVAFVCYIVGLLEQGGQLTGNQTQPE